MGNLPFPTPIQGEQVTSEREQRAFYPTTEVDPKQWFVIGQRLEELLNKNTKLRLSTPCSLEDAVVRLKIKHDQVKNMRTSTRNYVPTAYEEEVTKVVEDWARDNVIRPMKGKAPVNLAVLAVNK